MNKFKKLLSVVVGGMLLSNIMSIFPVGAEEANKYGLGDNDISAGEMQVFLNQFNDYDGDREFDESIGITALPSSIDLSDSQYFPPIGDQGNLNSCASWVSTYYQFTYEAHKLNNIVTTSTNAYSPSWTFNFTNGGQNEGTTLTDAYNVLINQGALTMAQMPYNNKESNYNYNWSKNTDAMISALNTRVSFVDSITIPSTGTYITSNNDSDLLVVKALLNSGKVLVARCTAEYGLANWSFKEEFYNGEQVAYRSAKDIFQNGGGHGLTIVGYNDNICCDVNGNGTIEACERGAFKVANSWGSNWGNDGYVWVLYDALNAVSANKINNWESNKMGTRVSIFDRGGDLGNAFFYMNVDNYKVGMISLLTLNTSNKNKISAYTLRGSTQEYSDENKLSLLFNSNSKKFINDAKSFNGTLVLPYGNLDNPISICTEGYYYGVRLYNVVGGTSTTFTNMSCKLVDNLKNIIYNFNYFPTSLTSGSITTQSHKIKLQKGDLNYDGAITSEDVQYLMDYVLGANELSNVQYYLGDYDNDGRVNTTDIVIMRTDNNLY